MNTKEIREIKRRLRPDFQNINHIYGCYVSEKKEIISEFNLPVSMMMEDEKEKYLGVFKKALSGQLGKNLNNLSFATKDVSEGEDYKLLYRLRETELKDSTLLKQFYEKVISALSYETNYIILTGYDAYDVPSRHKDGSLSGSDSENMFRYFICAICPVTMTKAQLTYIPEELLFKNKGTDFVISNPDLGFMFPAFDDRSTNLYGCLYYTKNTRDSNDAFVQTVFHAEAPMPAVTQKETFQSILQETLETECSLEIVKTIQNGIMETINANKEMHEADIPTITKNDIVDILTENGVEEGRVTAFSEAYDQEFGAGTELAAKNLVNTSRMEIKAPDIVIHINSARSDLVEAKTVGESKYLMIRLDETVELNGLEFIIS